LDHAVTRSFDTSHLSRTCPNCDSFERFANEAVIDRFETLEASPPAALDWERLERREKLIVAERLARTDKTLDDFDVIVDEIEDADETADATASDDAEAVDGGDAGGAGERADGAGSTGPNTSTTRPTVESDSSTTLAPIRGGSAP
jgi:hypothetical protein